MSKEMTEKWKNGELPDGFYYVSIPGAVCGVSILDDYELQAYKSVRDSDKIEVLAPVPSYRELYGENDGNMPTGVFTVLKIIKRDIENAQKRRSLTDLECGIKSQVVSLLKKWGVE